MMPSSVAIGYQHFGGRCCLHLQREDEGSMDLLNSSHFLKNCTCNNTFMVDEFECIYFHDTFRALKLFRSNSITWQSFRLMLKGKYK